MSTTTSPGRLRGPRTVPRSRLLGVLLAIALLTLAVVGSALSEPGEGYELVDAPLDRAVRYQEGEVVVSDPRVGTVVEQGTDVYQTAGLFVVVHVAVRATGTQPVTVASSRLVADGATYEPAFLSGDTVTADPGFVVEHDLVYEVDPARTADLTLELWDSGLVFRYYERTRTGLGITRGNAAAWDAAGRGNRLPVPRDLTTTALP